MKSLALLPCEKVIRDAVGGPSLIATFQEINFGVPAGVSLPANAVVPKEWVIFAIWQIAADETQREYSQNVEVIWPDGNTFSKQALAVTTNQPDWITAIMGMSAFPAGQQGKVVVRVWMEFEGARISEVIETWVRVNHSEMQNTVPPGGITTS